ncbi:unnamed protein product, partial [Musa banksii]
MSWARPEDVFSISLASYLDDFYASEISFLDTLWIDLVCHLSCENLVIESRESDCVAWSIFLHLSDKTGNPIAPSFLFLFSILLVLLLDGQKITGILRSFDKFASVVVEGACEQVIVGDLYCDVPLGLYVIRGDNSVLVGELDLEGENLPIDPINDSVEEIRRAQQVERDAMDLKGCVRKRMEFLYLD